MKIELDNAQSGGAKITITDDDGIIIGMIHMDGSNTFTIAETTLKTPEDYPIRDGIVLYED